MNEILIKGGYVIDPVSGIDKKLDILISGSYIKEIKENIEEQAYIVIDATGLVSVPGLCDMHVHLREPGYEYKEDIKTGTEAAALGGFCTVACMPNTDPVNDNPAITEAIKSLCNQKAVVNVLPIGAISRGLDGIYLSEMGLMQEAGCVAFSDDGKPVKNSRMMYLALEYAKNFNALLISHCEDLSLNGDMNQGVISTLIGLKGIPNCAESIMVARDLQLAEELDTKVHIAHVSTKQSVELIRDAKKRGIKVTCETCPHYIVGTDEMVIDYDTNTKVNPPLRSQDDRTEIIRGIVDGTIDAIVTDHAPHHIDDKRVEYSLASNGISGLESAFSLCYTFLVREGYIDIKKLIKLMSNNPLSILGQNQNGILVNNIANITLLNLDKQFDINVEEFASKGKNNPFNGWSVMGKVEGTIVNGNPVMWKGVINSYINKIGKQV